MTEEEKKIKLLEKLAHEVGTRQSITFDDIEKLLKSKKLSKVLEIDELADYLAALGVIITGEHTKITVSDPLGMYFHDIGNVKILGKEKELQTACRMRSTIKELQKTIPILTLSIHKFISLGKQLEHGGLPIDEFTISSFRPEDITPTEHRTDILLTIARIESLNSKLLSAIKSCKIKDFDSDKYWEKKGKILEQLNQEIDYINPSLRIIELVLPIFVRLNEYWTRINEQINVFLKLAGLDKKDAKRIFLSDENERDALADELGLGEETVDGIVKEFSRYWRARKRICQVSLIPLPNLLELINKIPLFLDQYEYDREQMIKANVRLVVNIARNYMNQGVDFLDLIQEGNHALLKAVERFDPEKGFKLATYAIWWIRQGMIRAIAEQGQVIRLPAYLIQWARKYSRMFQQLAQEYGREPTSSELSDALGLEEREIEDLLQALQGQISLDKKIGHDEDSRTLGEVIEDRKAQQPSLMATLAVLQHEIHRILSSLSKRESEVIALRFGLDDNYPRTLEEIGKMFRLSRERIRQIESRALAKLRHPARMRILEAFLKE